MLTIGDGEVFLKSTYPGIKPGRYMISNYGTVINTKTGKIRKFDNHKPNKYIASKFRMANGKNKHIAVHRLVAWEFCSGYNENYGRIYVNHIDYHKDNNQSDNLEWCTHSENEKHKRRRYKLPNPPTYYGHEHPSAVYDDATIKNICQYLEDGCSIMDIMNKFGYKYQNDNKKFYNLIYDIKRRKTWNVISHNYNF